MVKQDCLARQVLWLWQRQMLSPTAGQDRPRRTLSHLVSTCQIPLAFCRE